MKYLKTLLAAIAALSGLVAHGAADKIIFDRPADFFEETLPIGSGLLGAVVYGGTGTDTFSLNDITLWSGEGTVYRPSNDPASHIPGIRAALDAEDYRKADKLQRAVQGNHTQAFQPLGTLTIDYGTSHSGKVTGYTRTLDLSTATATTTYNIDGTRYTTTSFASAPDTAIIIRITAEGPAPIRATLSLDSKQPHSASAEGSTITSDGYAPYHLLPSYYRRGEQHLFYDPERGTRFRTVARVLSHDGGTVKAFPSGQLLVDGAREVVLAVTNATSFNGPGKNPATEGRDQTALAASRIDRLAGRSWQQLYDAHQADYRELYDRVSLDLGTTDPAIAALPTEVQLKLYTDSATVNPELEALYFNFGRYLLISSSRTEGVPANLQGLWNEHLLPPWNSNYTVNINVEENYWPAEVTNLSELHRPLLGFIDRMSESGRNTARVYYGIDNGGWCAGHNSDIWALTCPVGYNEGAPIWANWNMGAAWLSTHIWQHYLFTRDREALAGSYPALRGAALFCLDWLVEKDGKLMTSPSTSPENKYVTPDGYHGATLYGGTADLAMVRQCLLDTRDAARTLDTDPDLVKRIDRTLKKLAPYKVGADGNLQEWYYDWADDDPQHRHQSHLVGLYPGTHITVSTTPELADAARRTLEIKGDKTTGWSTGWRINLRARLSDREEAYKTYRTLLTYVSPDGYKGDDARRGGGTYPNLFDAHSPFQIDGNFGGCAGVAEMLLQSTPDTVTLLPALPQAWAGKGSVKGLCTRGGLVVDFDWADGKVTSATLTARDDTRTTVNYNGKRRALKLKKGESMTL